MNTRKTLLTALFSGLIIVGTFIKVPIPPVPITLQSLFIVLAGLILGAKNATLSVLIYLILGAIGLPVFTGGGGIAAMIGPTGGFLLGFLIGAFVIGYISDKGRKEDNSVKVSSLIIASIVGSLIFYAVGIVWLKVQLNISWAKSFAVGMAPFVIGDALKVILAVLIANTFNPRIGKMIHDTEEREED